MKPGYKQTDVGVIPEEWEVKTIDQIGFVTSGKRLPLGNLLVKQPTPHPYIRACPKIRGFRSDFFRLFIWLAQLNLWVLKMASNGVIRFDFGPVELGFSAIWARLSHFCRVAFEISCWRG